MSFDSNKSEDGILLNPTDPIESVLLEIVRTNRRKRADYAAAGNIFSNFIEASYQVGGKPAIAVEILIGTKQSRLRNLMTSGQSPQNESFEDTLLDRAVYSVIALAMYRAGVYNEDILAPQVAERASTMVEPPVYGLRPWYGETENTKND